MFLKKTRVRKLRRVLLTCDDGNIPSYKTIERCGGKLLDKVKVKGRLTRRYWIATEKGRGRDLPGRSSAAKETGPMTTRRKPADSIDRYIARFPKKTQILLKKVRRTIRAAAPGAQETIKYQIPTFVLEGNLIHFGAYKTHLGLYPTPSGIARYRKALSKYATSKGAIQFPLDQPIPYGLIAKITKFRVRENRTRAKRKQG
jgi:uncharacterized protein YdhG (YjbR/CyaY superfamily)